LIRRLVPISIKTEPKTVSTLLHLSDLSQAGAPVLLSNHQRRPDWSLPGKRVTIFKPAADYERTEREVA